MRKSGQTTVLVGLLFAGLGTMNLILGRDNEILSYSGAFLVALGIVFFIRGLRTMNTFSSPLSNGERPKL